MEASCCGHYASSMRMLCIGFIVLFYGSIILLCLVTYPKLPKEATEDEESGEPLPPAVMFARDGVMTGRNRMARFRTEECAICLEDFEENEIVRVLSKCRHVFHVRCIDSWCTYRLICPSCRAPFRL